MKKLLLFVLAFVMFKVGYSQGYPIQQFIGADSAIVTSKGAMQSRFVNVVFADTTAANSQRIKQYPGAMIYASGKMWVRNTTATGWTELAYGPISTSNIYNSDGTLTGDRTLSGNNFELAFNNISIFDLNANNSASISQGNQYLQLMGDTGVFARRVTYNTNLGSSFTKHSLVDKNYVDSSILSVPSTNIYNSDGALTGNRSVDGDGYSLTFSSIGGEFGVGSDSVNFSTSSGKFRVDLNAGNGTKALRYNPVTRLFTYADTTSSLSGYVPYVGATQNVNLGQFGLKTEYVEFDTTTRAVTDRTLSWSDADGTLNLGMTNGGSITQKVGLQQFARVRNVDTVAITKGQAVYISGASGDRASVKLAVNKGDATSSKTLGVAAENIPINDIGLVGTFGTISNLNLGGFTAGQIVYLDSIPGQLTATKPQAPYHIVFIGVVERANAGNGLLFVNPQNGYELDELHNVRITSPVRNNAILAYDSVAALWKDTTLAGIGGISGSGTTNYLSKWTSSSALGNSLVFDNGTNVGIGTTSPAVRFDVVGNTTTNNTAQFGTIGIQSFAVNNAWFGDNVYFDGTDFRRRVTGSSTLFYFAGTEGQFRFGDSGNAGTVISSFGKTTLKTNTDGTFAVGPSMNNSAGTYTNARLVVYGSTGNMIVGGTTDAGYKLDVNGTARVTSSSGTIGMLVEQGNVAQPQWIGIGASNLATSDAVQVQFGVSGGSGQFFTGTVQGDMVLKAYTQNNTRKLFIGANNVSNSAIVVFPSANTGLGTTTDAGYRLDVSGTFRSTGGVLIGSTAYTDAGAGLIVGRIGATAASRAVMASNTNYQDFAFVKTDLGSGNINAWGFGQRFDTYFGNTSGSFQITGSYVDNSGTSNPVGGGFRAPLICNPNGDVILAGASANAVNGNVGIGFPSPANALHIDKGTATAAYLQFTANTTTGRTATDGFEVGIDASGNGVLNQQENLPMLFYTNNTERMRIDNSGNVGIGTTSPGERLVVSGNARVTGNLTVNSSTTQSNVELYVASVQPASRIRYQSSYTNGNTEFQIINDASTVLNLGLQGSAAASLAGEGFLGVGTSLNISATTNLKFNTNSVERARLTAAGRLLIGTTTESTYLLDVNGTARVQGATYLATGSGNVGINTTSPSYRLDVVGNGRFTMDTYITGGGFQILGALSSPIGSGGFELEYSGGIAYVTAYNRATSGWVPINIRSSYTSFTTSNVERMRLVDGGLGIGTSSPNASALLDVSSTTKGFLPPRMTGANAEAIGTPAAGLLVYINNGNGTTITSTGWWGYDGTTWVKLN